MQQDSDIYITEQNVDFPQIVSSISTTPQDMSVHEPNLW